MLGKDPDGAEDFSAGEHLIIKQIGECDISYGQYASFSVDSIYLWVMNIKGKPGPNSLVRKCEWCYILHLSFTVDGLNE